MRIFVSLFILISLMISNCFAMNFSQPVFIGHAGKYAYIGQGSYYKGGVFLTGTTYNDGNILRKAESSKTDPEYGTGLACWGDSKDALYCKYESYDWYDNGVISRFSKQRLSFGGKNQYVLSDDSWRDISKIETDKGITLYVLYYRYNINVTIDIIGCRKDGKWVRYIDANSVVERYFGKRPLGGNELILGSEEYVSADKTEKYVFCRGDTIIIPYEIVSYNPHQKLQCGEFRFKWDDAAQWFGVENVVL